MKVCSKCGEQKPLEGFYRDRRSRDGRKAQCKCCVDARNRRWYQENKSHRAAYHREWYLANRESVIARVKRDYERDPETKRASIREWQQRPENRQRLREYSRRTYRKYPEFERERSRRYQQANPERWRGYAAQRRALEGVVTPETQACIVGLLRKPCAYCGSTQNIEIDHILPLSRGGKHETENLAPACRPCNRSKGAKLLSEWPGVG